MNTPEQLVAAPKPRFGAIAMIDDGLRPMRVDLIPEVERDAVLALLHDEDVLQDLALRGMDAEAVRQAPDEAIEALTMPDVGHGMGFAKISGVSETTGRMIERRQMMRQIAESIRATDGCEVKELGPEDDLTDIARFDLVFIDYYMDDMHTDGSRAEQIAADVQGRRCTDRHQQIVLMSTSEAVRAMRAQFRKTANIDAASFAFVAKGDLDEAWKVKAHLEMLARGMHHSGAIGDYISAVKKSAKEAADALSSTIDDLDIGDFAYIQRIALHADGHPLGDYLSWLLSSHLTALAFEGALRSKQAVVDAMEFEDGPLSPAEPSIAVASLYHDALFARKLGALGGHPRAEKGTKLAEVPFVQLGDVFLTTDAARAVVVLSPDCDLAFSTDPRRKPDLTLGVILLFGDPNSVNSDPSKEANASTEGMVHGAEVYRIDWRFNSFQTVPLDELSKFLIDQGFDISKRDRLRPIYSLKLQHELGSHLMRVGPPVMPPIAKHAKGKIHYRQGTEVAITHIAASELVVSHFKKKATVRLTPALVAKLKLAAGDVLDSVQEKLDAMPSEGEKEQKLKRNETSKVEALARQINDAAVWIKLLGDHPVPYVGECVSIGGPVYLAAAGNWTLPARPGVVLVIGEEAPIETSEVTPEQHPANDEAANSATVADAGLLPGLIVDEEARPAITTTGPVLKALKARGK